MRSTLFFYSRDCKHIYIVLDHGDNGTIKTKDPGRNHENNGGSLPKAAAS